MKPDSRRAIGAFNRGQAAVELALVAPVLVVLLMLVGEFLRIYYFTIALNDGADIDGLHAIASEYCQCSDGSSVSCATADACADERVYVEVDTSGTFYTLADWPGIPHSLALSGRATMREQ